MPDEERKKPDWKKIKVEYITTDISYAGLAKKYGIKAQNIGKRGKAEGWVEKRRKHRESVVKKAARKKEDKQADRLAAVKTAADRMADMLESASGDEENFFFGGRFRPKEAKQMVGAIRELTATLRDLYNIQPGGSDEDGSTGVIEIAGVEEEDG